MFPGGQFCEFTPLNPDLCLAIENMLDNMPPGWKTYRLNTEKNRGNLAPEWYEQFFAAVPVEMLSTRKTGALANFEGVIYPSFNQAVHANPANDSMIDARARMPGMTHHRGTDWGASIEHPFTTVFGCYDGVGDWFIYDEYWDTAQHKITKDHAQSILARAIAWGWPEPPFFQKPGNKEMIDYVERVRQEVKEILEGLPPGPRRRRNNQQTSIYGDTFADPSRPNEINTFVNYGIQTSGANNEVIVGINKVRELLKINPISGKPKVFIHSRCKHLIEEMRKYRWKQGTKSSSGQVHAAPTAAPLKKDDDTVDGFRYMVLTADGAKGLQPSTASNRSEPRSDVPLERNRGQRPIEAARQGFFRK
jgi:hypothetical protein